MVFYYVFMTTCE